MVPSGPSLTSQARAAELNAATAARARIINGELADMSELPSSQPISLADFTTYARDKGPKQPRQQPRTERVENIEQFKRPNRPVDRYYPPIVTPEASNLYQPQPVNAMMYGPAPYPALGYYYPMYQAMPGYHQMYPSQINPFAAAIPISGSPGPRSGTPYFSRTGTPAVPPPAASLQLSAPDTPRPTQSIKHEKDSTPAKDLTPKPSPRKAAKEATQAFFTPQDLSPSKLEEDIIRFKAEAPPSPISEKQIHDCIPQRAGSEASPAQSAEVKTHSDHQKQGPNLDEGSGEVTPAQKRLDNGQDSGAPSSYINTKATSHSIRQIQDTQHLFKPDNPPSAENAPPKLLVSMDGTTQSDAAVGTNVLTIEKQLLKLADVGPHGMNISEEDKASLFSFPPKRDTVQSSSTPRRLESPFQHRTRSPVKYYKPIVNKYSKNVFESEHTRWQALRKVKDDITWKEFQHKPRVDDMPGPFKGFLISSNIAKNLSSSKNKGVVMPPPGLTTSDPMSGDANYAAFFERVLGAEDWFYQGISKK